MAPTWAVPGLLVSLSFGGLRSKLTFLVQLGQKSYVMGRKVTVFW